MTTTHTYCYRGYEIVPTRQWGSWCASIYATRAVTAHLTIYTADFGTREGRGCGQGEAEDRPRAGIVEFAHHGSSHRSFRCLVQGMFGNPQECREHAKECLEQARSAPTLLIMTKLESLAHLWLRLADELESLEAVVRRLKKPERKTS